MTFITTDWFAYNWNGNWKPPDCFHFFFNFQENKCWGRLTADWLLAPGRGTFHTQLCRPAPTWGRVHVNNNNIHPRTPQGSCFYKQLATRGGAQNWIHGTPKFLSSTQNVPEWKWRKSKGEKFCHLVSVSDVKVYRWSIAPIATMARSRSEVCNYNSGPEAKLQRQNTNFPVTRHTSHRVTAWPRDATWPGADIII